MICTKAYIKALPEEGSNIYKVEIPLMEDNTGTEAIFDALLCTTPGHYKGLSVGDAVFVDFEDDQYNNAIILGQLFTDIPTKSTTYSIINDLKVTDTASLPPNTRFGDYTAQDIMNLYNKEGGGSINDADLKKYVQWLETEHESSEGSEGSSDIEIIYADKIRVMTGAEYDKLIEELGSEGIEEDINFINTLHFLLSLPSDSGGGDDPGPEPTPPEPTPPTPQPGLSFKALANALKSRIGKTIDYSAHTKYQLSIDLISVRINNILDADKGSSSAYIYWQHFAGLEKGKKLWGVFYNYLTGKAPAGCGGFKAGDFENLESSVGLQVGDIVTFYDTGGEAVYCCVYGGDNICYGSDLALGKTTAKLISISIDDIKKNTGATTYKITRITQKLVNRHKGGSIT